MLEVRAVEGSKRPGPALDLAELDEDVLWARSDALEVDVRGSAEAVVDVLGRDVAGVKVVELEDASVDETVAAVGGVGFGTAAALEGTALESSGLSEPRGFDVLRLPPLSTSVALAQGEPRGTASFHRVVLGCSSSPAVPSATESRARSAAWWVQKAR